MKNQPIAIIGGGIGGLMTAIALNRNGIPCTVFEKSLAHDPNGAGLAVWANATKILDSFGLLKPLLPLGGLLQETETRTPDGRRLNSVLLQRLTDRFGYPSLVLLRSDLQKTLLEALPAEQVRFGKAFERLEKMADGMRLHFADGTSETASAVLFADGIHSLAKTAFFNSPPLRYAGRTSWRGVAAFQKSYLGSKNLEILGKGRRIGIFPLPGNRAYWYAAVNMPEQEAFQQARSPEGVSRHFQGWADPVPMLFEHTPAERLILTNIKYAPGGIGKLALGSMALLGDAAHPMTPDLGQGACQAIEDAKILADCLGQHGTVEQAFQQYEKIRKDRVQMIATNSFRIGRLRQMENPAALALRNTFFRMMPSGMALRMLERNIRTDMPKQMM